MLGNVQILDVEVEHIPSASPIDIEYRATFVADDVVVVVPPSAQEKEIINWSDIESCESERPLLRDSTDGDTNDDDEGVDQGVPLPSAL